MKVAKPHVIRTDLGHGLSTVVPYGVSADPSAFARRLSAKLAKLARASRERKQRAAKAR